MCFDNALNGKTISKVFVLNVRGGDKTFFEFTDGTILMAPVSRHCKIHLITTEEFVSESNLLKSDIENNYNEVLSDIHDITEFINKNTNGYSANNNANNTGSNNSDNQNSK